MLLLLLYLLLLLQKVAPEGATVVLPLGFRGLLSTLPRDIEQHRPGHRDVRHLELGVDHTLHEILWHFGLRGVPVDGGQGGLEVSLDLVEFVGQGGGGSAQSFFLASDDLHSVSLNRRFVYCGPRNTLELQSI